MDENQQSNINFIPCVKWVKQGIAKSNPEKVQLTKEELAEIINETKSKLQIAEEKEGGPSEETSMPVDDEFSLEKYDEEADTEENPLGIAALAELPNEADANFDDSDDSDKEDDLIKKDDNLVLVGRVEGDAGVLEVYVYNESEGSLYVHHDFLLPAFPLAIEWLDHEPGQAPGNYCAIGSMNPVIDIWDLDIINCLEPAYSLGQPAKRKKNQPHIGHKDAVLALSWNKNFHHILASGSADNLVMLWDIDQCEPSVIIKSFLKQVQCMEWHKLEAQTLLAGSSDKTARVFDCRNPETHQTWVLKGEAEKVYWNPLEPFVFFAGTDNGFVQCFDCRKGELWEIEAHSEEISGLVISSQCPGMLLTTSSDGLLKTWDFKDKDKPILVHEKDLKLGKVLSLDISPNSPFTVAAGGDKKSNNFKVLDLLSIDTVKHVFGSRELTQLVTPEESMNG
nr:periodic tryptophan protein 1 homolog [Onthophagus taurus]